MKKLIQLARTIGRQSQKLFYQIRRTKRVVSLSETDESNKIDSRKRNSHGFPNFIRR